MKESREEFVKAFWKQSQKKNREKFLKKAQKESRSNFWCNHGNTSWKNFGGINELIVEFQTISLTSPVEIRKEIKKKFLKKNREESMIESGENRWNFGKKTEKEIQEGILMKSL